MSRLVKEIGGALISTHPAGVLHSDVKASNVLLDDDGAAYLTDFGIAVAVNDRLAGEPVETGDIRDLAWVMASSTIIVPAGGSSFADARPSASYLIGGSRLKESRG